MSDRGLILALQRFHDDPGFADLVRQDAQSTLGIYDLDDQQREALLNGVMNRDANALRTLADTVGYDWTAQHSAGVGALGDEEVSTEDAPKTGISMHHAPTVDQIGTNQPIRPA